MLKRIELLPEHIIDQIKAGEVIERPSTLIKELIENSIDAGSTKIKIQIINSGLDLISIEDNGHGIPGSDLPLAFCRHATSKIFSFEDIYNLYTYGFRGEALASIASISKLSCTTNIKDSPIASIKMEGGAQTFFEIEKINQATSHTSIFIKDLFYNTPVRMKFIQSKTSEKNQLKKIINGFILTHPQIEFDISFDDESKIRHHQVPAHLLKKRVKDLFQKRNEQLDLIEIENSYDGFKVNLIISLNSNKGNAGKFHYIFINDRIINDIAIHKIVLNSAKDLWTESQTGSYCLYIYAPTNQIDVNVHPNKTTVKIFQAPKLYTLISSIIKNHLSQNRKKSIYISQEPLISSLEEQSSIKYKEQSFDQDFEILNYFEKLDFKATQESSNIIYQSERITLFKSINDLLLIDNFEFIKRVMDFLIKKNKMESSALLVSEPIKYESKDSNFDKFLEIGYEIDRIDTKTIVIRAFPTILTEYPYLDYIKWLLNPKSSFSWKPKTFQINFALQNIGIADLIISGFMKKLDDKILLNILK